MDKYPTWLEENKAKLDKADFERYTKQKKLMQQVCEELEKETEADSESTKRERFDRVLSLMHKVWYKVIFSFNRIENLTKIQI